MTNFQKIDCFTAFLDILGFKEMVEHNDFDKLLHVYENAFLLPLQLAASGGSTIQVDGPAGLQVLADMSKAKVDCLIISDSVVLWNTDKKMTSFPELCSVVAQIMVMAMYTGVPVRGTITKGTIGVFDNILNSAASFSIHSAVGKPIVQAFREEQLYEWSGCTITDSCIDAYQNFYNNFQGSISDLASLDYLVEKGVLVRYPAPQKSTTAEKWVVDWPRFNRDMISPETIQNSFVMHGKTTNDRSVQNKLTNTIHFAKFSHSRRMASSVD